MKKKSFDKNIINKDLDINKKISKNKFKNNLNKLTNVNNLTNLNKLNKRPKQIVAKENEELSVSHQLNFQKKDKGDSDLNTSSNNSTPLKVKKIADPEKHTSKVGKQSQFSHPDHTNNLVRLKKVKGQIEGIERMILNKRYCPDILTQIRAATSALKAVEGAILKAHLQGCVLEAFQSDDEKFQIKKIEEILKLIF